MSQSPESNQSSAAYDAGWSATMQLVAEGRSWSGNERNCAFLNGAGQPFADISALTGLGFPDDGRAVGIVDWDGDGDLDLWLRNRTGPRLRLMRNGLDLPGRSVAVRLRGKTANRDGIGARVELHVRGDSEGPRVRTLHAGHGFRSQSSKWLHFGLPSGAVIESFEVRWPGGAVESFAVDGASSRFLLEQGTGRARARPADAREVALQPGPQPAPDTSAVSRALLTRRPPRMELPYRSFDDPARKVVPPGSPTLVNLWASWCAPCARELAEVRDRKAELDAAGLRVVAVSVEGLDPDGATTPADAARFARELGLPFETGLALDELVDKLDIIEDSWFPRKVELAVPTSLLLDAQGRVAAIYRGQVPVDEILRDLPLLQLDGPELLAQGLPLEGRWHIPYQPLDSMVLGLAGRMVERYPADGLSMSRKYLTYLVRRRKARGPSPQLDADLVQGHLIAGESARKLGRINDAGRHFTEANKLAPNDPAVLSGLGSVLALVGRTQQAVAVLQQAERLDPHNATVKGNLGIAWLIGGQAQSALPYLEQAVRDEPGSYDLQYSLGTARNMLGRQDAALAAFRAALQIDPNSVPALRDAAWILSTAPADALRDGQQSLTLARRAATLASGDASVRDTLAAAHAELGDFAAATREAEQALALARREQNPELAGYIESRLQGYRSGRPYRER